MVIAMSKKTESASSASIKDRNPEDSDARRDVYRIPMRFVTPVAVLLISLVLVEIVLQIAAPVAFSDRLYWIFDGHVKARLEPNQPVVNTDGNTVQINRLGFRGKEWKWRPDPGTLRVVALGGSSTFCFQVSDDRHTWPAQLERELNARLDIPVEVLNLGLPGFDTSNSKVNYLFTGRALNPHVVLVYHTWNDMKFLRPIQRRRDGGTPQSVLSGRPAIGTNPSALAGSGRGCTRSTGRTGTRRLKRRGAERKLPSRSAPGNGLKRISRTWSASSDRTTSCRC
jgi:hypothetical protein